MIDSSSIFMRHACPACGTSESCSSVYLEENIRSEALSGLSYASRKPPEFMCHRMFRCEVCGLVYAKNPPSASLLENAYRDADFDSVTEAEDAAESYAQALTPLINKLNQRGSALEIGTGTGIFLEKLRVLGFPHTLGVEPSLTAIQSAPPGRRAWIRSGVFRKEDYTPESFDLVCCFMTLEHVADPGQLAKDAFQLLKPGGALAVITHDYTALINRLLGRRSPIVDIEHLQLFSPSSIRALLRGAGYENLENRAYANRYPLRYWLRLTPLPGLMKSLLLTVSAHTGLADKKFEINVGNLLSWGFRSE